MAHGDYLFKGADEPVEVFEVGGEGIAPLAPPARQRKGPAVRRRRQEQMLGWRPAVGLDGAAAPAGCWSASSARGRSAKCGSADTRKLKQHRVFKFCFDAERLRSFKRELTLFRLLRDALGERPDIARLYDVCLDQPAVLPRERVRPRRQPARLGGGAGRAARTCRWRRGCDIVAQVADAVAAAHSVGVLHKDIKPTQHPDARPTRDGSARARS